ncbi:MAG: DNA mismatch repair endonuclease MutL [Firmicutes bacterium]|nr:DNA mismatch repair endonuclease MutL [Bacillota bacterium]
MGKINILDSAIYNRIAAGEVVERPASIVKELVENSIDAGADIITINTEGGGTILITVSDNGCGIEKDDVEKAFLPHATSKIKYASDLDSIITLGFRGEALCSIAAVSDVTLTSRTKSSELAQFISIDHGKRSGRGEVGAPYGTNITVKNLFGKVPARKKFLQKNRAEEAEITSVVARLILANNTVGFKYIADGKTVFYTSGKGLAEAIYAVYSRETLQNLTEVNADGGDTRVFGYVSRPGHSKYSRSYQTLMVNGRYIKNADISYTVYGCFKDYLMTRQYPMFVLFIELPPDMVDVNVHPSKTEAKFAALSRVNVVIKEAINKSLYGERVKKIEFNGDKVGFNGDTGNCTGGDCAANNFGVTTIKMPGLFLSGMREKQEKSYVAGIDKKSFKVAEKSDMISRETHYQGFGQNTSFQQDSTGSFDENYSFATDESQIGNTPLSFLSSCGVKRVGKLFDTYILVEEGENAYIIDQHAAHERLVYDEMYKSAIEGAAAVQSLLIPYFFSLTYADAAGLDGALEDLARCGIIIQKSKENSPCQNKQNSRDLAEIDGFLGTMLDINSGLLDNQSALDKNLLDKQYNQKSCDYLLCGVPLIASNLSEQTFIKELTDMIRDGKISSARPMRERIIMASCKAAVKAGDDLSDNEIDALLRKMAGMSVVLCPHGRPAIITLPRAELEKWFKRKV